MPTKDILESKNISPNKLDLILKKYKIMLYSYVDSKKEYSMRIFIVFFSFFMTFMTSMHAKNIEVATGNAYVPFAFVDESGKVTGYDVSVLRVLEKYDSDLKFNFNAIPWNATFAGLESGKYDLIAFQITKTKEREKKYIFSDYSYFNDISSVIVKKGTVVKKYEDMNGFNVGVSVGSNYALDIENFLKEHPDIKVNIKYYKNPTNLIADLGMGRINAVIGEPISSLSIAKTQGFMDIEDSGVIIKKTPVFFVFNKTDVALKDKVSAALKKAIENGDISNISTSYFGRDLSK